MSSAYGRWTLNRFKRQKTLSVHHRKVVFQVCLLCAILLSVHANSMYIDTNDLFWQAVVSRESFRDSYQTSVTHISSLYTPFRKSNYTKITECKISRRLSHLVFKSASSVFLRKVSTPKSQDTMSS